MLEQELPDRRDAEDDRAAFLRHRRPDLGRVEPGVEDDRAARREDRDEERPEAARVVERREDGAHVGLRQPQQSAVFHPFQAVIRCGTMTPFGLPVVPLV